MTFDIFWWIKILVISINFGRITGKKTVTVATFYAVTVVVELPFIIIVENLTGMNIKQMSIAMFV